MSWFTSLFSSAATQPINAIGNVLDELFTSDDEKLDKKIIMQRLALEPGKLQVELSKIEAGHRSIFVAGWRPFIGWVCGVALLYNFIVRDILAWALRIAEVAAEAPPELAMEHLMTILMGILGLGGYRTIEKLGGKAK